MRDVQRSGILYRDIREDDQPLLATATLGNVNWSGPRFTAEQVARTPELAHYFDPWPRAGDFGVVAERDETPIGVAWARLFSEADPGYGFVASRMPELSVWVAPDFRGRGVGTRLLELVLDEARALGRPGVSLSVEAGNPARRLYERFGFARAGTDADEGTLVLHLTRLQ